ncbi:hypothetical protein B9Q03_06210 [Candidatus Marsarchaeota G2 archaeon OSP_D]|jgi:hypothetical protein|uniref:Uncharacterized protein n=1 Tax=Candidatus Marsarchaeota G2 archaeon OSP_D TaxID=1978157 RepID=A0A2R6AWJ2_9ARCH|nr:MAG: hypothetical protein B9Q03_06210 [Candidatus Marsarchaeota G2 archaeon OSP_D]
MVYEFELRIERYLSSAPGTVKSLLEAKAEVFAVKLKQAGGGGSKITRDNQIVYTKEKPLSTLKINPALEKPIDTSPVVGGAVRGAVLEVPT